MGSTPTVWGGVCCFKRCGVLDGSCKETQASPVASMKVWLLFGQLSTAELKPLEIAWVLACLLSSADIFLQWHDAMLGHDDHDGPCRFARMRVSWLAWLQHIAEMVLQCALPYQSWNS